MHSKTKIDNEGQALAKGQFKSEDQEIESELIFDDYRRAHLQPLTAATYIVQNWLGQFNKRYYIAQRRKRRPQIRASSFGASKNGPASAKYINDWKL
ncbi:MAG: hypothetical protein QUS13_09930 [Smithella sp.]|nr:hypothetical protein [Smithella sp.]